jgi:DMSO reductase family type II enzyme heme b subunit
MISMMKKAFGACALLITAVMILASSSPSFAAGNAEKGKTIYAKRCWWCHGKTGGADGPASKFLIPPPRDFTAGLFKFKTSPAKVEIARDEDMFNMITDGMPGTGMPSWKSLLSDQDRWDVVAYIKTLTDLFKGQANPPALDYSKKVATSKESIEKGAKAFEAAKCFECHGTRGKGNMMKKLKEDGGARVWPRNFTKAQTFRAGHTPEAIFSRVTNGIPGTPMTSFAADTTGNGKLSEEDRWHVANYVMSLEDPNNKVKEGQIVVKGVRKAALPKDEKDAAWNDVDATTYPLVPQIVQKDRWFTPTNDLISVKAVFTDKDIAFFLEWDDRTKSVPGDAVVEALSWGTLTPDAVAIQTPVIQLSGSEKPYFGHGDATHAVSMMYWNAGTKDAPNVSKLLLTSGSGKRDEGDAKAAGFTTSASYEAGTWKVMMKRSLTTANKEKDAQFAVGTYIPVAFANWDGSNEEAGSKHTMTIWYWLLLVPETGTQVATYPAGVFLILVIGQFALAAQLRRKYKK